MERKTWFSIIYFSFISNHKNISDKFAVYHDDFDENQYNWFMIHRVNRFRWIEKKIGEGALEGVCTCIDQGFKFSVRCDNRVIRLISI